MNLIKLYILLAILLHGGRTDSRGGHNDNINGGYHYHHGFPAHSHSGGCPYRSGDSDGGGSIFEITSDDSFILWVIRIILLYFSGLFLYVFIGGAYERWKFKRSEKKRKIQQLEDERERIIQFFDKIDKDRLAKKKNLQLEIKDLQEKIKNKTYKDYNSNLYSISKAYLNLSKFMHYSNKEELNNALKYARKLKVHSGSERVNKMMNEQGGLTVEAKNLLLSEIYYALNERFMAYNNLPELSTKDRFYYDSLFLKSKIKYDLNDFVGAEKHLIEVINYKSINSKFIDKRKRAEALFLLSQVFEKTSVDKEQIIKNLKESITLDRSFTLAVFALAYFFEKNDSKDKSLEVYQDGVKNFPSPEMVYHRGMMNFKLSKFKEAMYDFKLVLINERNDLKFLEPREDEWYFGSTHYFLSKLYKANNERKLQFNELRMAILYKHQGAIKEYLELTESLKG